MRHITELKPEEVSGKTVLVRVDYNVPVRGGVVIDDLRIKASFQTVEFLRAAGAHIILVSHIENKENPSLEPVAAHINQQFTAGTYPFAVHFRKDLPQSLYDGSQYVSGQALQDVYADAQRNLEEHQVVMFENLRVVPGEKENDPVFSTVLAGFADFYINEAFSVSHRGHASVVGVPALIPHAAGFSLINEIEHLNKGLNPTHPFIFILGGAKFETKLPLIEKFMAHADKVLVAGALFNDILKAKGYAVGTSLVSDVVVDLSSIISSEKLIVPATVIVQDADGSSATVSIREIQTTQSVLDMGPDLIDTLRAYLDELPAESTPFVLWNGPLGNYEIGFKDQTIALARLISEKGIDSILGGGDTTAAIAEIGEVPSTMYVSTGGGAMIEFLQNETLPGIDALK